MAPVRTAAALLAVVLCGTGACAFPEPELDAPVAAAEGARTGGSLRVAIAPPGSLDPVHAANQAAQLVVATMCDTLVTIDPVTGDPLPGLAESWIVADGGKSISFRLRRGAKFHDGTDVTSKEVVASLRRLADPATGSHLASLLVDVGGFAELQKSVSQDSRNLLRGVRAIEPLSFEVVFASGKHPDFVRALSHPATAPVQADAADRSPTQFGESPTCSGPYRLAAPFVAGNTELRLVRATPDGRVAGLTRRGAGYVDEVAFRVVADDAAGYAAWTRGEVDIAAIPPGRMAEATKEHREATVTGPAPRVELIGLSGGEQSSFAGAAIRRALAQALDRDAIARDVFGGSRVPATGFLPPSLGRLARADACRFGPPRAAQGDIDLPSEPLTLAFNDEFAYRKMAEVVAQQWRDRLGLEVRLVPLGWEEYLQKASSPGGFAGAFRMSWTPPYASGLAYLGPLFHSRFIGTTNLAGYQDTDFDRAFDLRASAAEDERERELELHRLEDRLCQELPLIPVAFSQATVAMHFDRVAAARADKRVLSLAGDPLLRELSVR